MTKKQIYVLILGISIGIVFLTSKQLTHAQPSDFITEPADTANTQMNESNNEACSGFPASVTINTPEAPPEEKWAEGELREVHVRQILEGGYLLILAFESMENYHDIFKSGSFLVNFDEIKDFLIRTENGMLSEETGKISNLLEKSRGTVCGNLILKTIYQDPNSGINIGIGLSKVVSRTQSQPVQDLYADCWFFWCSGSCYNVGFGGAIPGQAYICKGSCTFSPTFGSWYVPRPGECVCVIQRHQ